MLARTSTLHHSPSGVTLQTPLLIPSFSSKGQARSKLDDKSEVGKILATASEFLTETYLISAYDVFYGDIPGPSELPAVPELIFLDSGGYEISTDKDYSSVVDSLPAPNPWTVENWESVVSSWPLETPLVAVSYDHHDERTSFINQVELARKRFRRCSDHLHSFLIKPESPKEMTLETTFRSAVANVSELKSFDIIGVTEKELGSSMLKRMARIATLRLRMDEAKVEAPIHVFGALDPITVCLYYMAGAEIFDGLTWLRYAYDDGKCVYPHNHSVCRYGLDAQDSSVKGRLWADNCYYLQALQRRLREFKATSNFDKLIPHLSPDRPNGGPHPHSKLFQDAWDSLETHLDRSL